MKEQDKSTYGDAFSFENNEGQRVLLSCNRASSRCPSLGSSVLSSQTLNKLEELGSILRNIHRRMKSEGYDIVDGIIEKL